jgi:hypothetical protein
MSQLRLQVHLNKKRKKNKICTMIISEFEQTTFDIKRFRVLIPLSY